MNDKNFCIGCGKELTTIFSDGAQIAVADAWAVWESKESYKRIDNNFLGYQCNDCHFGKDNDA